MTTGQADCHHRQRCCRCSWPILFPIHSGFQQWKAKFMPVPPCLRHLVFWAILKWENVADEPHANRWLIFIAYLMGLSIGVHLLNLLAIPAIVLVYYFRKYAVTPCGIIQSPGHFCLLSWEVSCMSSFPGAVKVASIFRTALCKYIRSALFLRYSFLCYSADRSHCLRPVLHWQKHKKVILNTDHSGDYRYPYRLFLLCHAGDPVSCRYPHGSE